VEDSPKNCGVLPVGCGFDGCETPGDEESNVGFSLTRRLSLSYDLLHINARNWKLVNDSKINESTNRGTRRGFPYCGWNRRSLPEQVAHCKKRDAGFSGSSMIKISSPDGGRRRV
jgi:hypothetical protein